MNSLVSSLHSAQPIDAELEQILEAAVGRLQAGERVELDGLIFEHPEYAEQLRELWPAAEMLVRMGEAPVEPPGAKETTNGQPDAAPEHKQLGDFRILRELGRGGMGTVYEAEQLSMGRHVALKVLPFAALVEDKSLQRFRNEVRAAAALDHPHIVSVYSGGEERGVHFYAMSLIRGQTLAEIIAQMQYDRHPASPDALSPTQIGDTGNGRDTVRAALSTLRNSGGAAFYHIAAQLGIQAAGALQHAHDQGVLHRDIKPGNLMLDAEGQLYVTDFGLARIEADAGLTMTGDIIGTLRYMAPEQALAKRVVIDHRADVYTLGATLYELLTLQPAFGETDRSELLKQIAFEEPRPLRKLDRRIPPELETIVLKAMEKSPDDRYQTAGRLADDLQSYLEHRPIKAKPPTLWGRTSKWSRRHKALVTSAAVSTAALVLISIGVLAFSNVAITRERNEKAAALARETQLRRQAEAREKIAQVSVLFRNKNYAEAEHLLDEIPAELIRNELSHAGMRRALGWLHAVHERWQDAARNFDKFLRIGWLNDSDYRSMEYVEYGTVVAAMGDRSLYERFRQETISQYANTTNPIVAERISRVCLLQPAGERTMARVDELYDLILSARNDPSEMGNALASWGETNNSAIIASYQVWGSLALSIVEYRRGNYSEAIEWTDDCLMTPLRATGRTTAAQAIAAMAYYQLQQEADARTALVLAHIANEAAYLGVGLRRQDGRDVPMVPIDAPILPFVDGLYGFLLLSEADALINAVPEMRNQRYATGRNLLGNMYSRAVAVNRNDREAVNWYQKAADQGLAVAQLTLGYRYSTGQGVTKDLTEAAKWYVTSTNQFAWTCGLGPDVAQDLSLQIQDAEEVIANYNPNAANSATIGAVFYRAREYRKAQRRLEQSIAASASDASAGSTVLYPQLLLAMTMWQQGMQDDARRRLTEAEAAIDEALESPSMGWERIAIIRLLHREASNLIRPPALQSQ